VIHQIINLKCQDIEGYISLTGLNVGYVEGITVSFVAIHLVLGIQSAKIIRHEF
jgi:hypothetical protein